MSSILDINFRAMICLDAMVSNDFILTNAAIEVDVLPCFLLRQLKRIEAAFSYDVFEWGKRKPTHTVDQRLRLTKKGEILHRSFKWFLTTIHEEIKQ